MGEVIKVDFLFARLHRDISNWYKKYYYGKDNEKRMNTHLMVMKERYNANNFSLNPVLREQQVTNFLIHVQNVVSSYTF